MEKFGKWDALIFDLDGTLWDTCAPCAIAWNNVARRMGIDWNNVAKRNGIPFREVTAEDVRSVTGKTHEECIRTVFQGLPEAQLATLVEETMVEDNRMIEQHGGVLYPGVREGLPRLAAHYPLHIVSNCQAGYIEVFLEWSEMGGLFQDFECWGNTGASKGENIRNLMARNAVASAVYIGDTDGDRQAALRADLPFIQVTYGFGSPLPGVRQAHTFSDLIAPMMRGD